MLFAGILGCLAITAGCKSKKSVIAGLVDRPANSLNTVATPETTPSVADAPPAPLPTVSPKPDVVTSITIAAVGDIMLGTNYPDAKTLPAPGTELFGNIATFIESADIAFGNLEGTILDQGGEL